MKSENEPAISLPEYFKSVKKWKKGFTKKKQTNEEKKMLLGRESNPWPPTCKVNALGSFSIDDEDGSEKVTFKIKWIRCFFQTFSRLFQFTENVKCGRISLELIPWGPDSSLERARKIRRRLFTFSINREIRHFHVWCIVFLPFSLPSPSSLLKLPIIYCATTNSTEGGKEIDHL